MVLRGHKQGRGNRAYHARLPNRKHNERNIADACFLAPGFVLQDHSIKQCRGHSNYWVSMDAFFMSLFNGWSTFKFMIHSILKAIRLSKKAVMQRFKIPQRCYNSSCANQHPALKAKLLCQLLHPHRILAKGIFDQRVAWGSYFSVLNTS